MASPGAHRWTVVSLKSSASSARTCGPSERSHEALSAATPGGTNADSFEHSTCICMSLLVVSPLSVGGRPPHSYILWGVSVLVSWFAASGGLPRALSADASFTSWGSSGDRDSIRAGAPLTRIPGFGRPVEIAGAA
jgi:hypothetical protein